MIKIWKFYIITKEEFTYDKIMQYYIFDNKEIKSSLYNKFKIIIEDFIDFIIIDLKIFKFKLKNKFLIEKIIKNFDESELLYLNSKILEELKEQQKWNFSRSDKVDFEKFFSAWYSTENPKIIKLYYEFLLISNTNLSLKEIRKLNYTDFTNFIKIIKITKDGSK